MPAFLVHGVPDTHRVWDRVRAELDRSDVIAPDLPGFGAPLPDGFTPTKEGYADWLVAEIEKVGEPVDLVGHDWGSLLVQRVLGTRPDLLSTCAFGGGVADPGQRWHDLAQMWQTDGVGEQIMEAMTSDALPAALMEAGIAPDDAAITAAYVDDTMKACILSLYRSAVTVFDDWAIREHAKVPTLVIHGDGDAYAGPGAHESVASRTGAKLLTFRECGHWWELERPAETAAALERLWATAHGSKVLL